MKNNVLIITKSILLLLIMLTAGQSEAQKRLYGMTSVGKGIFAYDLQTKQVSVITDLDANRPDGISPYGSLIQASNGKLYGMTNNGGNNTRGVIFELDPATNVYTRLYSFDSTNGSNPYGSLLEVESGIFYGMTFDGGSNNSGVVFRFNLATRTITTVVNFKNNNPGLLPGSPYGSLIKATNGKLYGMTGAVNSRGIIFEIDPATNAFVSKHSFGGTGNPSGPYGDLIEGRPGKLYGLTKGGGQAGEGTIFEYDMATATVTKHYQWAVTNSSNGTKLNGARPEGSLCLGPDSMLYGLTPDGGFAIPGSGSGVLFKFNPDSNTFTKLQSFIPSVGSQPKGTLTLASNGKLYGTMYRGGTLENKDGGIFEYDLAADTLILVHAFQSANFQDAFYCKLLEVNVISTGLNSKNEPIPFRFYPNPATAKLTITLAEATKADITIYDIQGKVVSTESTQQQTTQLNIESLTNGIYFITIKTEQGTSTQKFIKN